MFPSLEGAYARMGLSVDAASGGVHFLEGAPDAALRRAIMGRAVNR